MTRSRRSPSARRWSFLRAPGGCTASTETTAGDGVRPASPRPSALSHGRFRGDEGRFEAMSRDAMESAQPARPPREKESPDMSNVFELLHRAGEGSPGIRLDAAVLSAGSLGTFLRYSRKRRTARRRADARSQRKSRLAALHPSEPGGATMTDPTTMPFAPQCLCQPAPGRALRGDGRVRRHGRGRTLLGHCRGRALTTRTPATWDVRRPRRAAPPQARAARADTGPRRRPAAPEPRRRGRGQRHRPGARPSRRRAVAHWGRGCGSPGGATPRHCPTTR